MLTSAKLRQAPIRNVYIDCTSTCGNDLNSGIQRLVRNIVNTAPQAGSPLGLTCQGMALDRWRGFRPTGPLPVPAGRGKQPTSATGDAGHGLATRIRAALKAVRLFDTARWARRLLRDARNEVARMARAWLPPLICFGEGDLLLLADATWAPGYPWEDVQAAQARGALVGLVVYDLIPIQYPQSVDPHTLALFSPWWNKVRGIPDFIVCISKAVVHDIQEVDRMHPEREPLSVHRLSHFRLGAELDGALPGGTVRDHVAAAFGSELKSETPPEQPLPALNKDRLRPVAFPPVQPCRLDPSAASGDRRTYLMVGWICARKSQGLVLDAFERLWSQGADLRLVMVGKYYWDADGIVLRIRNHPQFGQKLFWFEDLSDAELDFGYRHAAAMITASYVEGFNIPIVEALSKGCPVIASDIAVHREVGGDYAAFFPSGDSLALARLISRHQALKTLPGVKSSANFHWPDWTESCRELLDRVVEQTSGMSTASSTPAVARSVA